MADISICPLDGEERLDVLYTHSMYAFRASPPFQDKQDFSLRGWGNPTSEIQSIMRGMFPMLYPFLHESF